MNARIEQGRVSPLIHPRMATSSRHILVLAGLASALVLFAMTPSLLKLDPAGTELWYLVGWITVPIVAGVASLRAAAMSDGSARKAWRCFGMASLLWMAGTVTWAGYGWVGAVLPFPSLADFFYIATSGLFAIGIYHYALGASRGGRVQATNFTLAICSAVAVGFILYFPELSNSSLGRLGTFIAFAYPAFWIGTWAFGLLCYLLYVSPERRSTLLLVLVAIGLQSVANFLYGLDLLDARYAAGTSYDALWIAGFALVAWAALEHGRTGGVDRPAGRAKSGIRPEEALVPALSLAAILSAGVAARWPHLRPEAVILVPVMFGFAALLAIREHALIGTERKFRREAEETARQLAESRERLSSALESTTDSVLVYDQAWRVTYANGRAIKILFPDREFLGISVWELFPQLVGGEVFKRYHEAMERQVPVAFETYQARWDAWFEIHANPTPDNLTVFFRNVTERRRRKDELTHLAQHDPLTGLANRTLFAERLAAGLQDGRRQSELALVMIDLNNFKAVNDSMGHQAGDCLLKQFASRLTGLVRQGDTVARLGGDEFAIIQPGPIEPDGGVGIARRISKALLTSFDVHGAEITLAASIGIAVAPRHGNTPEDLVRSADLALYRAKAEKGASVDHCIFETGMEAHLHLSQSLRLDLRAALAKGEFVLAYQPIIDLNSGRITRFEALLRWNHPTRGQIQPDQFIPLAEETGLIVPIGHWVLRQACADAAAWPSDINLAVNLSTVQLDDEELLDKVRSALSEHGLEAGRLEIEITESVFLMDKGSHLSRLRKLRALGVRITLDDFGTGYSSLRCLQNLPFEKLKIDRAFIGALARSVGSRAIVRAVTGLGQSLGIATTAEGVETKEQLALVRAAGCDEAQGFLFSRPVPADRTARMIQAGAVGNSFGEPQTGPKAA